MYSVSFSGPTLSGLKQGTQKQGGDFNCTATYCYPIGPANDLLFRRLQAAIAQAAKMKGITVSKTYTVDGNIGPGTVALAKALALKVSPNEAKLLWTLAGLDGKGDITILSLSQLADQLTPELEQLVYRMSPAGVAADGILPETNLPTANNSPIPSAPKPNVGVNVSLPTQPGVALWTLAPGGVVPSAGPQISITSPGVTLPGPNPAAGSAPVFVPTKPRSKLAIVGIGIVAAGLIGGLVWAFAKRGH